MRPVDRIDKGRVYVSDGVILATSTLAAGGVWLIAALWGLPS